MLRKIFIKLFYRPVVILNGKNNINPIYGKQAAEICELLNSSISLTVRQNCSDLIVVRRIGTTSEKFWKVYHSLNK